MNGDESSEEAVQEQADRFYVCLNCGRLKHENLWKDGAVACDDCHNKGRHRAEYRRAPDGDGFVRSKWVDYSGWSEPNGGSDDE